MATWVECYLFRLEAGRSLYKLPPTVKGTLTKYAKVRNPKNP